MSRGVALLGLGLVLANMLTGPYLKRIASAVKGEPQGDTHKAFVIVAGQFAFVLVLAMIADASADAGLIIVALLIGLWLVWAVGNADKITKVAQQIGAVTQ